MKIIMRTGTSTNIRILFPWMKGATSTSFQSNNIILLFLIILSLQQCMNSNIHNIASHALELSSMNRHYSNFKARQNHPTTYDDAPDFKGPLILKQGITTSDNRCRIKNYYLESNDDDDYNDNKNGGNSLKIPKEQLQPLKGTECTDQMLKTIVDHLAYHDAPVDVKEVAESVEFYLRTRKRLMGAAKKYNKRQKRLYKTKSLGKNKDNNEEENQNKDKNDDIESMINKINVFDLCSGHGLTGLLFAACNPPSKDRVVNTILVDQTEPPSHAILSNLIGQVCPWLNNAIRFETMSLEEFGKKYEKSNDDNSSICEARVVIATHACGSLTDKVLELAVDLDACSIAAMPCCYTGTDKGTPYGIKRALGVSWAADIRRSFYLNENKYHSDFSAIPREITPMNRIIVGEDRS